MNGLAVLLFGLVMYGCLLWFLRILKKDSHEHSQHFVELSQIAIVFLGMAIPILFFLWPLTYILLNSTANLPRWDLGFFVSLNNGLIRSIICIIVAASLVFLFQYRKLPRMQAPLLISIILLLGGSIYNLIQAFHDHAFMVPNGSVDSSLSFEALPIWMKKTLYAFSNMSKVSILSIFLFLKSYLGPLATGYVFCSILYSFFVNGKVEPFLVVLGPLLDWVFEGFPYWAASVYLVLQVSYNLIYNGFETLHE